MNHNSQFLPASPSFFPSASMRSFALICLSIEDGTASSFPIRQADSAADYVVAMLLAGQGDLKDFLWRGLLGQVVLRHVHCVDSQTISVLGYDEETDSILLEDSKPTRIPLPDNRNEIYRGWTSTMLDEVRKEQPTTDRYAVSVFKILANLSNAIGDQHVWDMIESDVAAVCPRRADAAQVVLEILDDEEDKKCKKQAAPPAKRCKLACE